MLNDRDGSLDCSCGASIESIDDTHLAPRPSSQPSLPGIKRSGARNKVPRQSLRALVQLHVVEQYVEGVTVRVCDGRAARHQDPIIFAQAGKWMTMSHTYERVQM